MMRSDHDKAAFSMARVHPGEWLTALCGIGLIVGLLLPWSDGDSALAEPGVLDVLLLIAALLAVLLPLVVSTSARTNVPIVYETGLWVFSLLLGLTMIIKVAFPPDGGFENGFWISLAVTVVLSLAIWRSVAREN